MSGDHTLRARNEGPGGCVPWEQHQAELAGLREELKRVSKERIQASNRAIDFEHDLARERAAREAAEAERDRKATHICLDCGAVGYADGYHDHGGGSAGDTCSIEDALKLMREGGEALDRLSWLESDEALERATAAVVGDTGGMVPEAEARFFADTVLDALLKGRERFLAELRSRGRT